MRYCKFYPKKVIQIWGVKLSTQISHVKFFIQKFYPNKLLSKIYVTYSTLLYTQKTITQKLSITRLILPYFINENFNSRLRDI